ncbi:uncharacterized protein J8A68_005467 [[Candida] subhashii]|uniref:RRM domain-containing protein n=1 Tax=[Candida] subhashii TaxID=561895 RepID=A0A8J5UHN4_9ASCO|nr:uncharacterized protein J8A68_005467 [[Candida] subhashii]KAG7660947.1 hypothetical protein J8A68_005467 [[Candida] subhashii]
MTTINDSPPGSPNLLTTDSSSSSSLQLHSLSLVSSQSSNDHSRAEDINEKSKQNQEKQHRINSALLDTLNNCILNEASSNLTYCNFPVILKVPIIESRKSEFEAIFAGYKDLTIDREEQEYVIGFIQSRIEFDELIYKLHDLEINYELDYSKFISHPGILFIKNLSSNLMFEDDQIDSITITKENGNYKLFKFLMDNCYFKSLNEVKLFNQDNGINSAFAIVKFSNYLDVDLLIEKFNKMVPNIFNNNETIPLFLNRYLNRKERINPKVPVASPINSLNQDNFNLIIVENLLNFIPETFTIFEFYKLIEKIGGFGNMIESVYFPIMDYFSKGKESTKLKCFDYGYIKFKSNANLMENTLKILYYLNELSWEEFINFDTQNLPHLTDPVEPIKTRNNKIQITIAQHKHNHYLYANAQNFYLSLGHKHQLSINFPNPIYAINSYCRSLNYQETNIYVNNLSVLFNNDDSTWEEFWKQFGKIKSAKIIKPQFYEFSSISSSSSSSSSNEEFDGDNHIKDHKAGKIGFIFYESFKMAIRAILMTNNKVVNLDKFNPILIQSSFAIQKSKLGPKNENITSSLPLPNNVTNHNNFNNNSSIGNNKQQPFQSKQKQFYATAAANIIGGGNGGGGTGATNGNINGNYGGYSQHAHPYHHHQPMMPAYPYYGYPNPYIICPPY